MQLPRGNCITGDKGKEPDRKNEKFNVFELDQENDNKAENVTPYAQNIER